MFTTSILLLRKFEPLASQSSTNIFEQRAVIKFCTKLGETPLDIYNKMVLVYRDVLSYLRVKNWAKRFREGRESLEDDAKSGHPISVITPHTIDMVRNIVEDDPHSTVAEIGLYLDISTGSVDDILVNHLEYRKISSRWAPHNLTQAQKSARLSCTQELLRMYQHADLRRLSEIYTGDETWVKHAEPLRKGQNKTWLPKGATPSTNPRPDFRSMKVLYCIFFDAHGIVASICVPKKRTITGQFYAQ